MKAEKFTMVVIIFVLTTYSAVEVNTEFLLTVPLIMLFRLRVLLISLIRFVDKQCSSSVQSNDGERHIYSKSRE